MIRSAIRVVIRGGVMMACVAALDAAELRPAELDRMLALYTDYGLPLPPKDAKFVRFANGASEYTKSGTRIPYYALGFWLNPGVNQSGSDQERPELLIGPFRHRVEPAYGEKAPEIADAETISLEHVNADWTPPNVGSVDTCLALLIQCHARGYRNLAAQLAKMTRHDLGGGGGPLVSGGGPWMNPQQNKTQADASADQSPEAVVARLAWNYWEYALTEEKSDWAAIVGHLKHVLEARPDLQNDQRRDLIRAVDEALKPVNSKPGSVEALIDDLMNVRFGPSLNSGELPGFMGRSRDEDPIARIEALGFEAIPALIAHCEDHRLTRATTGRFNNFPDLHRHLGEIVSDILQLFAANDLGTDWVQRRVGNSISKDAAELWWDGAQKMGEEKYALAHVRDWTAEKHETSRAWLQVVERKYPEKLPEVYDAVLAGDGSSDEVAAAIERLAVPKDRKLEILEHGLRSANRDHRYWALYEIRKIDPALADEALIKQLDDLPEKTSKPIWTSPEPKFVYLAMESKSPDVWRALLRAAKRANVSLRMQLMLPMDYMYLGAQQRKQRLEFLASFLDDETARDLKSDPELYTGPCAGFTFPHLEVRNFAATVIAGILEIDQYGQPHWTSDEWADFRQRVRKALETER